MKKTTQRTSNITLLLGISLIAIILSSCIGCKKTPDYHKYINTEGARHIPSDTTQQIVIWRTPNSDPGYLNKWLDSIYTKCGPFQITVFCGSCDSSLMLLTGAGIKTYIQGNGGGKGGGTGCTVNCPSGSGDTIYWCVNFPVEFNDPLDSLGYPEKVEAVQPSSLTEPITVAVFDTGIDPFELHHYLYENSTPTCLDPQANNGWNFPGKNNNVIDDYPFPAKFGHGAIVSRLIIEQVNHYRKNDVRILPVKIHNEKGESDLFSVLCGFAYAKERGAKIINASFGYYAPKTPATGGTDPGALLLKKYIEYYLTNRVVATNDNILLIAAAGNTNQAITNPERNLDNISFYPASLAAELPNVIAVTTVATTDGITGTVSPHQNYSANVVDIGINADVIIPDAIHGDHYDFHNPRIAHHQSEGSSYATPILTGIICSHYSQIKQNLPPGTPLTKDDIWSTLFQPGMNLGHITTLGGKIKTGVMLNKAITP